MTLLKPIALNNASLTERPTAVEFRLMLDALGGTDVSSDLAGVVGAGSLKVTQHAGTPNNTVDIAAGHGFAEATEGASAGCYYVNNDATVSIAVTTGNATNPRKDYVIVEVEDSAEAGTPDDAHFVVVAGTAAASPVVPDLQALGYDNYIILALIDVPALDTVITTSQITDQRPASLAWSRGRGRVAKDTATTSDQTTTSITDATGLTVTYSQVAGRVYETYVKVEAFASTINNSLLLQLADSSNTQIDRWTATLIVLDANSVGFTAEETAATSASVTRKARFALGTGSGTVTVRHSNSPSRIIVNDVGGVVL